MQREDATIATRGAHPHTTAIIKQNIIAVFLFSHRSLVRGQYQRGGYGPVRVHDSNPLMASGSTVASGGFSRAARIVQFPARQAVFEWSNRCFQVSLRVHPSSYPTIFSIRIRVGLLKKNYSPTS